MSLYASLPPEIQDVTYDSITDFSLIMVVNKENKLKKDFKPQGLTEYKGIRLNSQALEAFLQMKEEMSNAGITNLRLQSAYRPYEYQQAIFNQRVKELTYKGMTKDEATYKASQSIQIPGASEHQLGLALDVSINGKLDQSFAETDAGKWLEKHCHNYGFIIRYPKSKIEITEIIYEPWHLRYVGRTHAKIIKNQSLTLEEYLEYIKNSYMYVLWEEDGYTLVTYESESHIVTKKIRNNHNQ